MSSIINANQNLLGADGAAAPSGAANLFHITKAGVANITLAAPTVDGQRVVFVDETGHDHIIVVGGSPSTVLNGAHNTLTFNGTPGSAVELASRNGYWWTIALNGVSIS